MDITATLRGVPPAAPLLPEGQILPWRRAQLAADPPADIHAKLTDEKWNR